MAISIICSRILFAVSIFFFSRLVLRKKNSLSTFFHFHLMPTHIRKNKKKKRKKTKQLSKIVSLFSLRKNIIILLDDCSQIELKVGKVNAQLFGI
jgi:hypothetical protein